MSKQKSLILLKMLMGILNFAILTFLAVIILYTIGMVRATYTARSFLNHITYLLYFVDDESIRLVSSADEMGGFTVDISINDLILPK